MIPSMNPTRFTDSIYLRKDPTTKKKNKSKLEHLENVKRRKFTKKRNRFTILNLDGLDILTILNKIKYSIHPPRDQKVEIVM